MQMKTIAYHQLTDAEPVPRQQQSMFEIHLKVGLILFSPYGALLLYRQPVHTAISWAL